MNRAQRIKVVLPILVVTIALDQVTKQWALAALDDGHEIDLVPTLSFDLLFNNGFSFGTGQGFGRLIGVGVVMMVGYLAYQIAKSEFRDRVAVLSVILGGAIGNLIDRVARADDGLLSGAVVDFIDVSWFAVFNVADIFVVCGALTFGLMESRREKQRLADAGVVAADAGVVAADADAVGADAGEAECVESDNLSS